MTDKNTWADIIGPCYTRASVARTLGRTEDEVAEAAVLLDILELTTSDGRPLYPAFQIWHGRIVEGLGPVLQVLNTGTTSRWTWAQWLNTPEDDDSGEDGPSAIEQLQLRHLEDVLRDARHAAGSWRS